MNSLLPRLCPSRPRRTTLAYLSAWLVLFTPLGSACAGGFDLPNEGGAGGAASGVPGGATGGTSGGLFGGAASGTTGGTTGGTTTGTSSGGGTSSGTTGGTPSGSGGSSSCQPIADYFASNVWTPVLSPTCSGCHAGVSDFMLTASMSASAALTVTTAEAKKTDSAGKSLLLQKPIGQDSHTGGAPLSADSAGYKALTAFVGAVQAGKDCVTP